MATGAGKSCIYLVSLAVGTSVVGVVISPLNESASKFHAFRSPTCDDNSFLC